MREISSKPASVQAKPILLFNDECAVCRSIADWVKKSDGKKLGAASMTVRPIGDDPAALLALNGHLNIWDAYATIHLLMPDGSMKLGGEAVAEVLRRLPNTKWLAWLFAISLFGLRPFQTLLDAAYIILADVRPILGCESCGRPSPWVRPLARFVEWTKRGLHGGGLSAPAPRTTSIPAAIASHGDDRGARGLR